MEGYIKYTPEEAKEKFGAIAEEVLNNFKEMEFIIVEEDGSYQVEKDMVEMIEDLANDYGKDASEESELPENIVNDIVSLVQKYSGKSGDINLKKPMYLESRDSNVYAFYLFQNWIYLLDDEGSDIDPNDVELEFLESFLEYISDESNLD